MTDEKTPLVSVIMNCLNGEKYLREAIDSVYLQSYSNWEIIFYDNCSTDESAKIANSYGEKLRYIRGSDTMTLGAARNAALSYADGEFITFLDTDDKWLPQKLQIQVSHMMRCLNADLCYSNVFFLNSLTQNMRLAFKKVQPSGDVFASFLKYYPINLQTVMLRRRPLEGMSELFDPTLEVSEEYDLFLRFLIKSKAIYIDIPTAIYRIHPNMASIQKNSKYPIENEYILEKLRRLIPNLDIIFPNEIRYLIAKIAYWHAKVHMSIGDKKSARKILRPHINVALSFLILYAMTYLPSPVWRFAMSKKTVFGSVMS